MPHVRRKADPSQKQLRMTYFGLRHRSGQIAQLPDIGDKFDISVRQLRNLTYEFHKLGSYS
jgi:hypothetical protein